MNIYMGTDERDSESLISNCRKPNHEQTEESCFVSLKVTVPWQNSSTDDQLISNYVLYLKQLKLHKTWSECEAILAPGTVCSDTYHYLSWK